MVGCSPQRGHCGSRRSLSSRNFMSSALNSSSRPSSEVPLPRASFRISVAWMQPDDAGQHAEHAAFGAAWHQAGRRRFGIKAAVARPAQVRGEHAGLAFEAEDGAVDVGLLQQHAGVVGEVARGEVVGAVHHDVVGADDLEGVLAGQAGVMQHDLDVRVEAVDGFPGGLASWAGRRPRCRGGSGAGGWRDPPCRNPRCRACRCPPRPGTSRRASRARRRRCTARWWSKYSFGPASPTSGRIRCRE